MVPFSELRFLQQRQLTLPSLLGMEIVLMKVPLLLLRKSGQFLPQARQRSHARPAGGHLRSPAYTAQLRPALGQVHPTIDLVPVPPKLLAVTELGKWGEEWGDPVRVSAAVPPYPTAQLSNKS